MSPSISFQMWNLELIFQVFPTETAHITQFIYNL
jgi:hypothetical protein